MFAKDLFFYQFQDLKLSEFYCEGNPLFLKNPIYAPQPKDLWTLRVKV